MYEQFYGTGTGNHRKGAMVSNRLIVRKRQDIYRRRNPNTTHLSKYETQNGHFQGASRMNGGHWTDRPWTQLVIFIQMLHEWVTPESWENARSPSGRQWFHKCLHWKSEGFWALDQVITNISSSCRILCRHLSRVREDRGEITDEGQTFIDWGQASVGHGWWNHCTGWQVPPG